MVASAKSPVLRFAHVAPGHGTSSRCAASARRRTGRTSAVPACGLGPVIIFTFAFGLSMDYEVFLLSRITEAHDEGHSTNDAVAHGLQRSGRIITCAAFAIGIVFAGFAAGQTLGIKEFGLALAIAVAVDATLIRCVLVPATMTLLGSANWWAPAPLRRLHQRIGLREAPALPVAPVPTTSAVRPRVGAPPNSPSRELVGAGTGGRNAE